MRKWLWKIYRWKWIPIWYKWRYGVSINGPFDADTLYPSLGKGEFIDVVYNGPYLEITNHSSNGQIPKGMIRVIPCQYNHGVMVEFVDIDKNTRWRISCDYDRFYKMGASKGEHCEKLP